MSMRVAPGFRPSPTQVMEVPAEPLSDSEESEGESEVMGEVVGEVAGQVVGTASSLSEEWVLTAESEQEIHDNIEQIATSSFLEELKLVIAAMQAANFPFSEWLKRFCAIPAKDVEKQVGMIALLILQKIDPAVITANKAEAFEERKQLLGWRQQWTHVLTLLLHCPVEPFLNEYRRGLAEEKAVKRLCLLSNSIAQMQLDAMNKVTQQAGSSVRDSASSIKERFAAAQKKRQETVQILEKESDKLQQTVKQVVGDTLEAAKTVETLCTTDSGIGDCLDQAQLVLRELSRLR